jgi:hypothetical protein
MQVDIYHLRKVVNLARVKVIKGVNMLDGGYIAAPVVRNGSFIVLSHTALSIIFLLGWILVIAVVATYREEITLK